MPLDAVKNFAKVTVSAGYDAAAVSIVLSAGHGAKCPTLPANATWWNATDFPDPSDDVDAEIIRATGLSTDTLTVARAQEGTAATVKNVAGKTYKMVFGLTAKVLNTDLPATYQPLDATLGALAAFNTSGFLAQTAPDTFVGRTVLGTANQLVVTNGDGVAGNPTLSLPQNIHASAFPAFAGLSLTGSASSVLTGSINPTASTAVVGVGTLFTTELTVGDRITASGETRTVTFITDNTNLTVDVAFTDTANDTSPDKLAAIFVVRDSTGAVKAVVNNFGNVGFGTASPGVLARLAIVAADANVLKCINTGASSAAAGAGIVGQHNDGAAMDAGHRLGFYVLGGAVDAVGTMVNAAGMSALTEELWTSSSAAAYLRFDTTPTGSITRAERIRITGIGNVGIGVTAPTAVLHLKAGTATADTAPLKFTSGTNLTTPVAGVVEYNGRFHVTESDAARRFVVQAAAETKTTAGAPYTNDGFVTLKINGTDVKVMTTA